MERLDRVTWTVGRSLMIGFPVFLLVLLLLLPVFRYVGGGIGGVTIAFLGAAGAAWALERRVGRGRRPTPGAIARRSSRPISRRPLAIGLGVVAVAYILFVVVVSRGGA